MPRFVPAAYVLIALVACGCPQNPTSTGGNGAGTAAAPGENQPAPPREPDDAQAVAALEALGVKLKRDDAGSVVAADCTTAQLTNDQLEPLTKLPYLTDLNLAEAAITDEGLGILEKMPRLKILGLRRCNQITDAGLANLQYVPDLERLFLLFTFIDDDGMEYVAKLHHLRLLDLRGNKVGDDGLEHLREHPRLVDVKARAASITDAGVEDLATIKQLRTLEVEDAFVTNASLPHVGTLADLQKLNLMRTYVSTDGFADLSGLTKLRDLRLRGTQVEPEALGFLDGCRDTLVYLDLTECPINDQAGLAALEPFQKLKTLEIWQTRLNDEGLQHLGKLAALESLDISKCPGVTSAGIDHLSGLAHLESLNLSETGIDDAALTKLVSFPSLKTLDVRLTDVSPEAVATFETACPGCKVSK